MKILREESKLSQESLGNVFDVSKGTISSWESGRTQPPIETITSIAKYFGVTTDYLLGFNQDDIDRIERLKTTLKEAGMWNEELNDMTQEDFEKAMQIVAMLKGKNNE